MANECIIGTTIIMDIIGGILGFAAAGYQITKVKSLKNVPSCNDAMGGVVLLLASLSAALFTISGFNPLFSKWLQKSEMEGQWWYFVLRMVMSAAGIVVAIWGEIYHTTSNGESCKIVHPGLLFILGVYLFLGLFLVWCFWDKLKDDGKSGGTAPAGQTV